MIHLTNRKGASVLLTARGAGVVSIVVPDRNGVMDDVVLGYKDEESYIGDGPCSGKIPGRFANRIAGGHFVLDGKDIFLLKNRPGYQLHGGPDGFAERLWDIESVSHNRAVFALESKDGDQGYPGCMNVHAAYTWGDDDSLELELTATTDAPTAVNLTNHTYWNLRGENSGSILDHELQINASRWLVTDETLIPTGETASVGNTPMDFRTPKPVGRDMGMDFPALKYGKGYDNCWVIDGGAGIKHAATLSDAVSGRKLEIWTDQPAVQVYTGNWLAGSPQSKSGRSYNDYEGIAIECQGFPDAPNHPDFPSCILRPGETYRRTVIFRLSAV
ncbi:MAG TPA: galactose mutarotase [Candidatus Coprenecus stercoripullorum]|nr:galactose mutarotase [Candidatus Coprenecus stercoripullorum]